MSAPTPSTTDRTTRLERGNARAPATQTAGANAGAGAPDGARQAPVTRDRPLVFVFNERSGQSNAQHIRQAIERACQAAGRRYHLMAVANPREMTRIAQEAVQRAQADGGVVVASGGDGTLHTVAHAVLGSGCAFGVLPQGTFNYFGRTHGIPADIEQALSITLHGEAQPVQVGQVNGETFLVNASVGLYVSLLVERESWNAQFGRNRFVALAASAWAVLRGFPLWDLTVEWHGQQRHLRTPTLFVGNNALQLDQVGVDEAQQVGDEHALAGVALAPVGRLAMLWLCLRAAAGKLGAADDVETFAFRELVVDFARRRKRRVRVAMDGEVHKLTAPLVFAVADEPLWLMKAAGPTPDLSRDAGAVPGADTGLSPGMDAEASPGVNPDASSTRPGRSGVVAGLGSGSGDGARAGDVERPA